MTPKEYEKRLHELTAEELRKFNQDFGGGQKSIEQRVREYVDDPRHERRICQLLDLKTEAEKDSDVARSSMIQSRIAIIISIVAVVVSILGLFL